MSSGVTPEAVEKCGFTELFLEPSAVNMTISVSTILVPKPSPSQELLLMEAQNSTTSLTQSYLNVKVPSLDRLTVVTLGGVGISFTILSFYSFYLG